MWEGSVYDIDNGVLHSHLILVHKLERVEGVVSDGEAAATPWSPSCVMSGRLAWSHSALQGKGSLGLGRWMMFYTAEGPSPVPSSGWRYAVGVGLKIKDVPRTIKKNAFGTQRYDVWNNFGTMAKKNSKQMMQAPLLTTPERKMSHVHHLSLW